MCISEDGIDIVVGHPEFDINAKEESPPYSGCLVVIKLTKIVQMLWRVAGCGRAVNRKTRGGVTCQSLPLRPPKRLRSDVCRKLSELQLY